MEFDRKRYCRGCKQRDRCCGDTFVGYHYMSDGLSISKCNGYKRFEADRNLEIDCKASNVHTDYTWDSYIGTKSIKSVEKLKRYSSETEKFKDKSLYVYGKNSTQKTSMCKVLGKELIRNGKTVKYILMQDLIDILCDCTDFNEETAHNASMERMRLLNVDYLIIDECFDRTKVMVYKSGFQIPYLDTFLRKRLEENRKPIVFISNVEPSRIEDSGYGASINALVKRNTTGAVLEFLDDFYDSSNEYAIRDIFED